MWRLPVKRGSVTTWRVVWTPERGLNARHGGARRGCGVCASVGLTMRSRTGLPVVCLRDPTQLHSCTRKRQQQEGRGGGGPG